MRRAGEAAAVDDGGVVQPVREDHVLLADQRRDRPQVGREAGLERDDVLRALEARQPLLEFDVQVGGPGDGAHRAGPTPYFSVACLGGLDQPRMICQPEVVVGAEVEHRLARRSPAAAPAAN